MPETKVICFPSSLKNLTSCSLFFLLKINLNVIFFSLLFPQKFKQNSTTLYEPRASFLLLQSSLLSNFSLTLTFTKSCGVGKGGNISFFKCPLINCFFFYLNLLAMERCYIINVVFWGLLIFCVFTSFVPLLRKFYPNYLNVNIKKTAKHTWNPIKTSTKERNNLFMV